MPKSLMLPLVLCAALLSGTCSESESPAEISPSFPAHLAKTWQVYSVTLDGVETSLIEGLHRSAATRAEVMGIDWNGEYWVTDWPWIGEAISIESGTLTADGENCTFTVKTQEGRPRDPYVQRSGQWAVTGNTLALTIKEGGHIYEIRYVQTAAYLWE